MKWALPAYSATKTMFEIQIRKTILTGSRSQWAQQTFQGT